MGSVKYSGQNSFCQETDTYLGKKRERFGLWLFPCQRYLVEEDWKMLFFLWLLCAIATCPYSGSFYSVTLSLFPSLYLKCLSLTWCLQQPTWKRIKRLCHCHACRLNFTYIKPLYFGSWLCSDSTGHLWQTQIRRPDVLWGEKDAAGHYLPHGSREHRGILRTVMREDLGSEVWEIHAEICKESKWPLKRRGLALPKSPGVTFGVLASVLAVFCVSHLGLYYVFYFLRMLKP